MGLEKSADGIVGGYAEGLNLNLQGGLDHLDDLRKPVQFGKKKPEPIKCGTVVNHLCLCMGLWPVSCGDET
jgi:hypothetical protein